MTKKPLTQETLLSQPVEQYMDEQQKEYFRDLLLNERRELLLRIESDFQGLREHESESDPADVGSAEELRLWQLRMLARAKKLLDKIDMALERLARGEYGWCEETGEPIGLRRLLLRPIATLSIEAKERQELREKHLRES